MARVETVTREALAAYLGVDDPDEFALANLDTAARAANARLAGALGADADFDDARALQLGLMWAADAYDERDGSAKSESARSRAEVDIATQLRLEARARRAGA